MITESCKIVEVKECDILYQVKYRRVCKHCGKEQFNEHRFTSVLKNGHTMDIDNWYCPDCHQPNFTIIKVEK